MSCSICGFTYNCICSHQPSLTSHIEFALLYHENEQKKLTNTGKLITNSLPNARAYLWQRRELPTALLEKIARDDTETWLLFPSTENTLSTEYANAKTSSKKQLFILLDATWQEAKKMVNRSPWLQELPCLYLENVDTSSYHLRRNQSEGNLCTCEAGMEILKMVKEPENAQALNLYYERFLTVFQAERSGHLYVE